MAHSVIFAVATGMGLLTDKYELAVTNFVDHLADFEEATDFEKEFVKAAMYGGAVLGMLSIGTLSDYVGRRRCMIACSIMCLVGAISSAVSVNARMLIFSRIITGVGMGGEYPLGATHSADRAGDSAKGSRNVGLFYIFGSGGGQALCPLVVYTFLSIGCSNDLVWRLTFAVGALLAGIGLVLRILTTRDSEKFTEAAAQREEQKISTFEGLKPFAKPLIGTAMAWFLFDVVEYGLKQNDASIFAASADNYKDSVMAVFLTRLLAFPSLFLATFLPQMSVPVKWVQFVGFAGCAAINLLLALWYPSIHIGHAVLFGALYIVQLSFQSLPGVTTMAIPAEIFPSAYKGTAHGISAAMGKVGATLGSYVFAHLKTQGMIQGIFGLVTAVSLTAAAMTLLLTPSYDGRALTLMEKTACLGDGRGAVEALYHGAAQEEPNPEEKATEAAAEELRAMP